MATDNFLDKKSVLGLAERVPMCPPPETIVFANSIQWTGISLTGGHQHQYAENINTKDITNYGLLEQLAVGQSIACEIKINGELGVLPLFLAKYQSSVSAGTFSHQYEAKGTTVLSDGKIAGVIFDYTINTTVVVGSPSKITRILNCHVYIHYWGTL